MGHSPHSGWRIAFVLACIALPGLSGAIAIAQDRSDLVRIQKWIEQGDAAIQQGAHSVAIKEYNQALQACRETKTRGLENEILGRRAEAYQSLGFNRLAVADLETVIGTVSKTDNSIDFARTAGALGTAYYSAGDGVKAKELLQQSIEAARKSGSDRIYAASLVNLGNVLWAEGHFAEAAESYQSAAAVASRVNDSQLALLAEINAFQVRVESGINAPQLADLAEARNRAQQLPASFQNINLLVRLGMIATQVAKRGPTPELWLGFSSETFSTAIALAQKLGDKRSLAIAHGSLGESLLLQKNISLALRETQRAIFYAQDVGATELSYKFNWQEATLRKLQGEDELALKAYRKAVQQVQDIRVDLTAPQQGRQLTFRQVASPLYTEYTEALLRKSRKEQLGSEASKELLIEARRTTELLKAAELQDYFQDDCVAQVLERTSNLESLPTETAAVYPIFLADRTELLVSTATDIKQFIIPMGTEQLIAAINRFRQHLETRNSFDYVQSGGALYDAVIRPIESMLESAGVKTIVFIPEGAFRTIPIAALYDGRTEQFLIQKYAVAVAPGLDLVDLRPFARQSPDVFYGGLTEARQGFPALPFVKTEINQLEKTIKGTERLDARFSTAAITSELQGRAYSIVHFATHAQFGSTPAESFVLTHDGRLFFDQLEQVLKYGQFREDPLELITLSACQTAAGDDRAALGLGGIAVKAGARSAVATLWFINDQASAKLISTFYSGLAQPNLSRAQAMQQAQTAIIKDPTFSHPYYWAAFLMIGSWL